MINQDLWDTTVTVECTYAKKLLEKRKGKWSCLKTTYFLVKVSEEEIVAVFVYQLNEGFNIKYSDE